MNRIPGGVLGVRTVDGAVVPLLDLQRAAPGRAVFTTIVDGQSQAVFDFYYRSGPSAAWTYLDSLSLPRIPPARAGVPDLEVEAVVDSGGNLVLQMHDPVSKRPAGFVLERAMLQRLLAAQPGSAGSGSPAAVPEPDTPTPSAPASRRPRRLGPLLLALVLGAGILAGGLVLLRGSGSRSGRRPSAARAAPAQTQVQAVPSPQPEPAAAVRPIEPAPAPSQPAPAALPAPAGSPAAGTPATAPRASAPPAASPAAPTAAVPATPAGAAELPADRHPIAWGDTLWRIAERYYGERGLYRELAESNALEDPDRIIAGRTLVLPPALADRKRKLGE